MNIKSSCGGWRTYINEGRASAWPQPCKVWACKDCRPNRIRKEVEKFRPYCQGPMVFLIRRSERKKDLSNWIGRHKSQETGSYTIRIGTITEAWIVSTHPFRNTGTDEVIEMSIGEFCDKWLPGYINKNFMNKLSISPPKRLCWLPNESPNTGQGRPTQLPRNRSMEYNELETNSEKADWLDGAEAMVIAERERKFIETYKTNRGRLSEILPMLKVEISLKRQNPDSPDQ